MKTEKIIEICKKHKVMGMEGLSEAVGEEIMEQIKLVSKEQTNPRREYLGEREYFQNKSDGKFFYLECVKYSHGYEFHKAGEAKVETKSVYFSK